MNAYAAGFLTALALTIFGAATSALAQDANPFEGEYRRFAEEGDTLSIGSDGAITGCEEWNVYWQADWYGDGEDEFFCDQYTAEYYGEVTADGEMTLYTTLTIVTYVDGVMSNYGWVEWTTVIGLATSDESGNLSLQGAMEGGGTSFPTHGGAWADGWWWIWFDDEYSETWTWINPNP